MIPFQVFLKTANDLGMIIAFNVWLEKIFCGVGNSGSLTLKRLVSLGVIQIRHDNKISVLIF